MLFLFLAGAFSFFGIAYAGNMMPPPFSLLFGDVFVGYFFPILIFCMLTIVLLGFYLYRYRRAFFLDKNINKQEPTNAVFTIDNGRDINVIRINKQLHVDQSSTTMPDLSFKKVLQQQGVSESDSAAILRMVKQQFKLVEFGLIYGDVRGKKKDQLDVYHVSCRPVLNKKNKVIRVDVLWKDRVGQQRRMKTLVGQAERDHLTGLANKMRFDKFLDAFPETAKQGAKNVLCFMDLDNFKPVNDTAGHAAGDELLKQLADIFRKHVRSSDLLARTGGDEFVILFPDCSMHKAKERFESIINHVSSLRFSWEDKSFVIGISMGAVEFDSGVSKESMSDLCKVADDACYTAKQKGRNQLYVHDFNGSLKHAKNMGQDNWAEIIRDALDHDKFKLYVQPIIPLNHTDNDKKKRFEIYIRLPYNGRVLRPGSFFPAAERAGLSRSIDRWVVRQVFARLSRLNDASTDGVMHEFTINLSVGSLLDDSFSSFVSEQLRKHNLNASSMCFEVSESAVVSNFTQARKFLVKLATLGCSNSLDDFGSGLSALNYIRDLPIHYLKIDGVFVRNIEKNQIDAAMIHSLNHMSKVMNLKTVAEFVEDEHTAILLRRLGVNYAQGYYCGRPLPLERLEVSKKTTLTLVK
jgi:Amt family ammonium transporter